jgi:hypothetical protein
MQAPRDRRTWQLAAAIAVCLAAGVALQVVRDRGWNAYEPVTPLIWIQAGPIMQRAALGYDALIADIYWMRAVVYYGGQHLSEKPDKTYDLLFPFLELVTSLDPRFTVAYRYGAIFLSEPYPSGPGRPDQAIELLRRGLEFDPTRWDYARDIGFVHAWTYRDFQTAAQWFEKASEMPNAPVWLKSTAAMMLTQGGKREAARALWRELYETAEVESLRATAAARLAQIDALDHLDQLNAIMVRYKERTGQFPTGWDDLAAAGVLRGVPLDPTGTPYVLNRVEERVELSEGSPLWPLPTGLDASKP